MLGLGLCNRSHPCSHIRPVAAEGKVKGGKFNDSISFVLRDSRVLPPYDRECSRICRSWVGNEHRAGIGIWLSQPSVTSVAGVEVKAERKK